MLCAGNTSIRYAVWRENFFFFFEKNPRSIIKDQDLQYNPQRKPKIQIGPRGPRTPSSPPQDRDAPIRVARKLWKPRSTVAVRLVESFYYKRSTKMMPINSMVIYVELVKLCSRRIQTLRHLFRLPLPHMMAYIDAAGKVVQT
jgi:hypothetical protein